MTSTGFGFGMVAQLCFACLLASLIKPHWFRFNGKTPSRWKIGGIWGVLALVCGIGAMSQVGLPATDATPTTATESATAADTLAVPVDIAVPYVEQEMRAEDSIMDAARPAEEAPATQIPIAPGPVYSERKVFR